MNEEDSETQMVWVQKGVRISADKEWLETVDEFTEESPFSSRAAAIRSMVFLGMHTFTYHDPRESQTEQSSTSSGENGFSPVTIRQLIPEGENNAIHIFDELPEMLENDLLDIIVNDPEIERNGNEVYR